MPKGQFARWTEQEKQDVCRYVAELTEKHGPAMALSTAWGQANVKYIENPKRRHGTQSVYGKRVAAIIENHRKKLRREQREHAQAELGLALAPAAPAVDLAAALERIDPAPAPAPGMAELIAVLETVAMRLGEISRFLQNSAPAPAEPKPAPPAARPRVVVAGLLPDQVQHVANAVGARATIEPWMPNGATLATPDFYVVVTGFLGHSMENRIRTSGVPLIRCHKRGTTAVIGAICRTLDAPSTNGKVY